MQKAKLTALAVVAAISMMTAAHADQAPGVAPAPGAGAIPAGAQPVAQPTYMQTLEKTTTIGRISAKHVELIEAEVQNKIDEAHKKSVDLTAPPPAPMPVVTAAPGQANMPGSLAMPQVESEQDLRLLAVYGRVNNLKADIKINGSVFTMTKGGTPAGGWAITSISAGEVTMKKGKVTKTLSVQTVQTPESMVIRDSTSVRPMALPRVPGL